MLEKVPTELELVPLIIWISLFFLLLSVVIIVIALAYGKRNTLHVLEKKEMENHFNQAILNTQIEIQEQTLKQVGQELHDNIGQQLGLAKLHAYTMHSKFPAVETKEIQDILGQALDDLRRLSKSLHSERIEHVSLEESIVNELARVERSGMIKAVKTLEPMEEWSPTIKLIVFRVLQELLSNVIKHSESDVVSIKGFRSNGAYLLSIADSGKGFDLTEVESGLGMLTTQSRLKLIGGSITIETGPGIGTTALITIPLEEFVKSG